MPERDWDGEIDRWTQRFRSVPHPPAPFAAAVRDGWTPAARAGLADGAREYSRRHAGLVAQLRAADWDLVRFDLNPDGCTMCAPYGGCAYSLSGDGLPTPPPLPICPACRHTLNLLTPHYLNAIGREVSDLAAESVPYREEWQAE